mmetsp:Transcript_31963/g.62395  ORF Transcript_31963/g.62395 Transcript_31963/m.62395 type:complete len:355 (-) Transcript_31963:427-1491(-)
MCANALHEKKMKMGKAVFLGLLLAAVVLVAAAQEPAADKPAADAAAKPAAADPTKGEKLAAKEGAGAAAGGEKKDAGGAKEDILKAKAKTAGAGSASGLAGKFKTEEERKKYAKMTPEERKAEREARMSERDKLRDAKMEERRKSKEESVDKTKADHDLRRKKLEKTTPGAKQTHAGPHEHMMSEFRGTAGMFMALVAPVKPVTVTFPLDDDTRLKFSAARDGLMKSVRKQGASLDVTKEDTKKDLRVKTKGNQEKTLEILLEAVKGGMTVQEARMGMVIAQFEALDDATKKEAMEKAKQRQDRMPSGARTKMNERLELKNKKERDQLTALKTDAEKEDFVKRIYRPRYNMATV